MRFHFWQAISTTNYRSKPHLSMHGRWWEEPAHNWVPPHFNSFLHFLIHSGLLCDEKSQHTTESLHISRKRLIEVVVSEKLTWAIIPNRLWRNQLSKLGTFGPIFNSSIQRLGFANCQSIVLTKVMYRLGTQQTQMVKKATISHICHIFYTSTFEAWKFYTQKCVNLRQKMPRDKTAKSNFLCKITHCV